MSEMVVHTGSSETLGGMLRSAGRRFAHRLAVTDAAGRERTYAQLLERGARFANVLRGLGAGPGDHVASMVEDRSEAVEVYVGVMLAGCVLVHVNARYSAPELVHLLRDGEVRVLVHTSGLAQVVADAAVQADLRAIISIGGARGFEAVDYETAVASASVVAPPEQRVPEDMAILAYTSGTTGRPKGAIVSHRSVVSCSRVAPYYYGLEPGSRIAYAASFSFVGTVWAQVFPALWMGGTVDILGRVDADQWVDRIARTGAAFTYVSSPRIGEFTSALRHRPDAVQALRTVMHSGSAAPRRLLTELFDVVGDRLTEHWGSTEIVGSLTATMPCDYGSQSAAEDVFSSVGRPLPSADVAIVGADGSPAEPGVAGEMLVRSDSMFSGYWHALEKTNEAFVDGWYRTADIGYRDTAGYVYLVGRSVELIVSGGANVYPAEVERVIQEMDAVDRVAVFGLPHDRWGETVVAAVVPRPGLTVTQLEVTGYCASQLAGYKKPTRVFVVDDLPTNASQKLDRNALRQRYTEGVRPANPADAMGSDA
jgi:acyl-CoA synthetase (AMP-forming)/AMP-acid ligase II